MSDDLPDAPWATKVDDSLPDAPWAKGGDFSWSQAVTDIPSEIAKEAKAGASDVMALGRRGEMGPMEGLMAVPKAVMGAARVPLSPITGAARSLVGHTMANLEHKAGEYIAPEIAARDDPNKMYETAKGDVDTAMSAMAARRAPPVPGPMPPPPRTIGDFDIPLSQGEAAGDVAQIARERRALRSDAEGARAHEVAQERFADRDRRIGEVREEIGQGFDPAGQTIANTPHQGVALAGQSLRDTAQNVRDLSRARYAEMESLPGEFQPEAFTGIGNRIRTQLTHGAEPIIIDERTTPIAARAIQDIDEQIGHLRIQNLADPRGAPDPMDIVGINLRGVDQARKRLITFYQDAKGYPPTPDQRAMQGILRAFDDQVENSIMRGLFSGDDRALAALREARGLHSYYKRMFSPQGAGDDVGQAMQKILGRGASREPATPTEIANMLYGSANVGGKGLSFRLAERVRDVLGERSPEWAGVRQGLWRRLTEAGAGEADFGPQKVVRRIDKFLTGDGQATANRMFTPDERRTMQRYADVLRQTIPPPGAVNYSNNVPMIAQVRDGLTKFMTAEIGAMLGGIPGAIAGWAVGTVGKPIADIAKARAMRRSLPTVAESVRQWDRAIELALNGRSPAASAVTTATTNLVSRLQNVGAPGELIERVRSVASAAAQGNQKQAPGKRDEEKDQGAGGKSHGGRINRANGGEVRRALQSLKSYADGGGADDVDWSTRPRVQMVPPEDKSPFDWSGVGAAMPENIGQRIVDPLITIPKRIGYDLPKELIEHSQANPLPGLRREDYTDVPADTSPDPRSPLAGVGIAAPKVGWQPVDPMVGGSLEAGMNVMGGTAFSAPKGALGAGPALRAAEESAPGPIWRSSVEDAIGSLPMNAAPADQWANTLRNAKGIKPEEMDWLGLQDFFAAKKAAGEKVTKQELMDHVAANKVELKDVVRQEKRTSETGETLFQARDRVANEMFQTPYDKLASEQKVAVRDALDAVAPTKYHSYQLPGATNYREHLLTMPERGKLQYTAENVKPIDPAADTTGVASDPQRFWYFKTPDNVLQIPRSKYPNQTDAMEYVIREKSPEAPAGQNYKSPHWDEPNVLAHVRTNDRVMDTPEGPKKTLHLEEVQSDWHQKALQAAKKSAKEAGKDWKSLTPEERDSYAAYKRSLGPAEKAELQELRGKRTDGSMNGDDAARLGELENKEKGWGTIPNAPFKDTDAWAGLALKRMIRHAAEGGYDRVSWTPGAAQAQRYDLSQHIKEIEYIKNRDGTYKLGIADKDGEPIRSMPGIDVNKMTLDQIEQTVGKDIAEKISKEEGKKYRGHEGHTLDGLDLKVGGEGMHEFYDKMLPKIAEKIGKAHGVKVKQGKIKSAEKELMDDELEGLEAETPEQQAMIDRSTKYHEKELPVWYFDLTPKLKEQAMKGMSMFKRGGRVTPSKPRDRSVALKIAYGIKGERNEDIQGGV